MPSSNYCCSRGGQKTIADSDLWRLPPTVLGFSLSLKVHQTPGPLNHR